MSTADNITSPSYPPDNTTARGMYRHMEVLRQWVIDTQNDLKDLVPVRYRTRIEDEPGNLPSEDVWLNVSIADHYWVLRYIQHIRMGWDTTLREHEDSWDSKLALRKRYSLLVAALHILQEAFIGPEEREMKTQQSEERALRRTKALESHFRQVLDDPKDPDSQNDAGLIGEDWYSDEEEPNG